MANGIFTIQLLKLRFIARMLIAKIQISIRMDRPTYRVLCSYRTYFLHEIISASFGGDLLRTASKQRTQKHQHILYCRACGGALPAVSDCVRTMRCGSLMCVLCFSVRIRVCVCVCVCVYSLVARSLAWYTEYAYTYIFIVPNI